MILVPIDMGATICIGHIIKTRFGPWFGPWFGPNRVVAESKQR